MYGELALSLCEANSTFKTDAKDAFSKLKKLEFSYRQKCMKCKVQIAKGEYKEARKTLNEVEKDLNEVEAAIKKIPRPKNMNDAYYDTMLNSATSFIIVLPPLIAASLGISVAALTGNPTIVATVDCVGAVAVLYRGLMTTYKMMIDPKSHSASSSRNVMNAQLVWARKAIEAIDKDLSYKEKKSR